MREARSLHHAPHSARSQSRPRPIFSRPGHAPKRPGEVAAAFSPVNRGDKHVARAEVARLAIFVSGNGSNFRALLAAMREDSLRATTAVVVTNDQACNACKLASDNGIPVLQYPPSAPQARDGHTGAATALQEALQQQFMVDYVLLAGYIKLIPPEVVEAFPRAILNIHPSLLPAFGGKGLYGRRVHRAVIASGARFTGPTVHFVDNNYDTGPILAQRSIPVNPLEDEAQLAARVLKEEHILYPQAAAALVEQRISWRSDGVPVMWQAH